MKTFLQQKSSMTTMKIFSFLVVLICFISCKEQPPFIDLKPPLILLTDTTYIKSIPDSVQPHNVLLEDFTGVRCGNCPRGHKIIEDLKTLHGNRVVALALHGEDFTNFTTPYDGYEDFRIPYTRRILDIIGKPSGLPFASFDRSESSSNTVGEWKSIAERRLDSISPVRLAISDKILDTTNMIFKAKYYMSYTQELNENIYYSVAILEYEVISRQLDDDNAVHNVLDYHHENLTRDFPVFFKQINKLPITEKGRTYVKEFEVKLPENIKDVKNCTE